MVARLTGGSVRYLRRVNTGNYEHKEFESQIMFSVDDGEDAGAMIERAGNLAVAETHYRLGLEQRQTTTTGEPVHGVIPQPEKVDGRTKAARAQRAPVPKEEAGAVIPLRADPLLDGAAASSLPGSPATASTPAAGDDPLLDGAKPEVDGVALLNAALAPITDGDLSARVNAKAKALGAASKAIIPILQTYATTVSGVPQDKRAEFLAKVEAL